MTYLAHRSSSARASRAGRAMGDADMPVGPAGMLMMQLNRFTSRGQYGGHVYQGAELASGNLSSGAAYTAAIIYQTRLLVAQAAIPDAGTAAQIAALNAAMATGKTPSWVAANIGPVTEVIKSYADSQRLPTWSPGGASSSSVPTLAVVLLIGAGAFVLLTDKRRKR